MPPLSLPDGQNILYRQTQVKHAETKMVWAFDREQATAIPGQVDLISGSRRCVAVSPSLDAVLRIRFGDAVTRVGSLTSHSRHVSRT